MLSFPFLHLIIGVINYFKNPLILQSDGQKVSKKLMTNPLICDPSESWSAIIITELYLRSFVFLYYFSKDKPKILTIFDS